MPGVIGFDCRIQFTPPFSTGRALILVPQGLELCNRLFQFTVAVYAHDRTPRVIHEVRVKV